MPMPRKYFSAEEKKNARKRANEKFRGTPEGRKAVVEAQARYEAKRARWSDTNFRMTEKTAKVLKAEGMGIVSVKNLERPPLYYIDAKGQAHKEDRRSAEELIEAWKEGRICGTPA